MAYIVYADLRYEGPKSSGTGFKEKFVDVIADSWRETNKQLLPTHSDNLAKLMAQKYLYRPRLKADVIQKQPIMAPTAGKLANVVTLRKDKEL